MYLSAFDILNITISNANTLISSGVSFCYSSVYVNLIAGLGPSFV